MSKKRNIEVFSAGCPVCLETVKMVNDLACPSCNVTVRDMNDAGVAARAKGYGLRSVPAVVINGKVSDCCAGGPDASALMRDGLGQRIS
ncbi:thioredoxin family protein [bacterium]|nr:thioredoxin family protein [bacterium]